MSYFVRLNFLFGIILFSVLLNASAAQASFSDVTPSIKRILINGDSVIFISDSSRLQPAEFRQNIILNYRNNNITIELQPADSINYQFFLETHQF